VNNNHKRGCLKLTSKGCFIVFEGIEGSGKTSTSVNLQKFLASKGFKVKWTREPTGSKIGLLIEDILMGQAPAAQESVPLLFAADRADHTKRMIVPWLKKGYIVVSDRYTYSSLAYQKSGMDKPFSSDWLLDINKYAIQPDLIVFLDITPELGLSRIGKGQRIRDDKYFEDIEKQRRIRQTYHELLHQKKPDHSLLQRNLLSTDSSAIFKESTLNNTVILTIDASQNQETIQNMLFDKVQVFLKTKGIEKQSEQDSTAGFKESTLSDS
jgi:dTMP kinase